VYLELAGRSPFCGVSSAMVSSPPAARKRSDSSPASCRSRCENSSAPARAAAVLMPSRSTEAIFSTGSSCPTPRRRSSTGSTSSALVCAAWQPGRCGQSPQRGARPAMSPARSTWLDAPPASRPTASRKSLASSRFSMRRAIGGERSPRTTISSGVSRRNSKRSRRLKPERWFARSDREARQPGRRRFLYDRQRHLRSGCHPLRKRRRFGQPGGRAVPFCSSPRAESSRSVHSSRRYRDTTLSRPHAFVLIAPYSRLRTRRWSSARATGWR